MNDNDMANMLKKAQEMINNNQIPDELKNLVANMKKNSSNMDNNSNNTKGSKPNNDGYKQNSNNNENSSFPDIDIETMMKLQNIMSKMKSFNNDDDMSKLLMSLKPYLRNEKKEKVDEYIKLIRMGKMTQAFDLFGGDKN